jgi:hypothetical protein
MTIGNEIGIVSTPGHGGIPLAMKNWLTPLATELIEDRNYSAPGP